MHRAFCFMPSSRAGKPNAACMGILDKPLLPRCCATSVGSMKSCLRFRGLGSAELHLQQIANRVTAGGHAVSEAGIRQRLDRSRLTLDERLPDLSTRHIYDNSHPANAGGRWNRRLCWNRSEDGFCASCTEGIRVVPECAKSIVWVPLRAFPGTTEG